MNLIFLFLWLFIWIIFLIWIIKWILFFINNLILNNLLFLTLLFALRAAVFCCRLTSRLLLLSSNRSVLFLLLRLSPFRFTAITRCPSFLSNALSPFSKASHLDSVASSKQSLDLDPPHYLFKISTKTLFFLACSLFANHRFTTFDWTS